MMLAMGVKKQGKNPNFTEEQNAVLREALVGFMERNGLNQPAMAKMLKIEQPSVGRYVQAKNPTGFAYPVATKVARLAGYIGVDALFAAKGVALDAKATEPDPNVDDRQAMGMVHARALGASERAIQLVNRRVDKVNYYSAAWWCTRYLEQEESLREAMRELSGAQAEEPKPESRRSRHTKPAANE